VGIDCESTYGWARVYRKEETGFFDLVIQTHPWYGRLNNNVHTVVATSVLLPDVCTKCISAYSSACKAKI
jgi:hypothetical protein